MFKSKKGSASVFLVFILAAMIGLVIAFIYATGNAAVKSYGDSLLNLAGRAVLSEFDLDLKKDYGFFAFYGLKEDIEEKIEHYVNYSIKDNKYVKMKSAQAYVSEYSLLNMELFQEQITEYMKYAIAKGQIDKLLDKKGTNISDSVKKNTSGNTRVLRNESVINSLPSKVLGYNSRGLGAVMDSVKAAMSSIGDFLKTGADETFVNEYILTHFKDMSDSELSHETFFSNEIEYILEGNYGDDQNRRGVRADIIKLRTAVNTAFIFTNTKMRAEVLALAELITPGPGGLLTQIVIAGVWALAEAENDMALLEHGRCIPLTKTAATWAVDLDSAWKGTAKGYIDTGVNRGMDYDDHLRLFLYFQDKPTKLARTMDLIQINMKGNYNRNFLVRDYNCGFQMKAEINGNNYVYEEKY